MDGLKLQDASEFLGGTLRSQCFIIRRILKESYLETCYTSGISLLVIDFYDYSVSLLLFHN